MRIINAKQGSPEWHKVRLESFTASEAPAMMSASKYQSRDDLLKLKKTGIAPDVSDFQQRIFDKGHAAEAGIRPHIEKIIGEELYPVVGIEEGTRLLASFDGLTMMQDIVFEHKLWNDQLAATVQAISDSQAAELEPHYYWQLEQQLMVSRAERAIFVVSDGTPEKMVWCWYLPVPERQEALIDGWLQFEKDLANYDPKEYAPKPKGEFIPSLPTLRVSVQGAVTDSNLPAFKQTVMAFIENINTDLATDQDFANAESNVKFCKDAEKQLETVKKNALAQTASIEELFRTVDDLSAAMRSKRLELDKLVKQRKEAIKVSIATAARDEIQKHWLSLVHVASPGLVPQTCPVQADLAGAMKGKKTVKSLEEAANDEVTRVKIEAGKLAKRFVENLEAFDEEAAKYKFLFNDVAQLINKETGDFRALVILRIQEHERTEQARLEAERQRIQAEAEVKAKREAEAKAEVERERIRQEERAKIEAVKHSAESNNIGDYAPPQVEAKAPPVTLAFELALWAKSKGLTKQDVSEILAILGRHGYDIAA